MKIILLVLVAALVVCCSAQQSCTEDSDSGLCRGFFPRFFFNTLTQTCEQFIYGGCGGNGNNYPTKEECEQACQPAR